MNNGIIFENNELSNLLTGKIALNEVYFGKTKELLAAEQQLDKFRNNYMDRYVLNMKVNSDPDLLEFDRMMEDIFGFGCFTMHIHNQAIANAFTMPIDYRYDTSKDAIITDKHGFKFRKDADYACILGIYSGIIFNPNFTTPEVMAIILHEVGHNFNSSINKPAGVMIDFYNVVRFIINLMYGAIIQLYTDTNDYRKLIDKTGKKWRQEDFMLVSVYDFFVQVRDLALAGVNTFNDLLRVLSMGTLTVASATINGLLTVYKQIQDPVGLVAKVFGKKLAYNSELSADNFVTMYGYSGDLSSAFVKMEGKEAASASAIMGAFDKIPIISTLMHFTEAPIMIIFGWVDEHPNDISRVKDQMELLKRELGKADIDPKMKRVIEKDIKECEEAFNHLLDLSGGMKDPYLANKVYNNLTNHISLKDKVLGGKTSKHKFEEYDKAFKNALNK